MNILIEGMSRQLGGMEAFIMSVYRGLDRENYRMDLSLMTMRLCLKTN